MTSPSQTRKQFIAATAGGVAGISLACSRANAAEGKGKKPNILYIFADQQHWQAVGFQDAFYKTPHQDRLAAEGMAFNKAFCSTPQCSPSRSSMLTGLFPSKTGVMGNVGAAGGASLAIKTIGKRLQDAGYHTGYFGKWHLGSKKVANDGWDVEDKKIGDKRATENAVKFLDGVGAGQGADHGSKPFALFVSINDPHDIYKYKTGVFDPTGKNIPLSESWKKETFKGKPSIHEEFMTADQGTKMHGSPKSDWQGYRDFYRAKVALYDDAVGAVLEALERNGLADSTVVISTSDHGDMDTNHKLIFKGPFMYEHMVRVPFIARVPKALGGKGHGQRSDFPTVNVDVTPTLLDFAGLDPIECDGLSLRPLLTGQGKAPTRDYVLGQYYSKQQWVNPARMIRDDDYKYVKYIEHGEELYDLKADPHELVNLASVAAHEKTRAKYEAILDKWIEANTDPFYSFTITTKDQIKKGKNKKA